MSTAVKLAGLCLAWAGVCAAQTDMLTFGMNGGAAPGYVSLNLILNAPAGAHPAAIQWAVNFPNADIASVTTVEGDSALAANKTVTCAGNQCLLWGLNEQTIPNGVIAVLTFQLAAATLTQVNFQLGASLAASPAAEAIQVTTSGGALSVVLQASNFTAALASGLAPAGSATDLVTGNGWDTTTNLINLGSSAASARMQFFGTDGSAILAPLVLLNSNPPIGMVTATLDQTIAPGAALAIDVSGIDPPQPQISSAQLSTIGDVGGFLRFRYTPTGQEASGPIEVRNASSYMMAFDNSSGTGTGVALTNLTAAAVSVDIIVRDSTGAYLDSSNISLPASGHTAFTLNDQFASTVNTTGTIQFNTPGNGQISVLGMRSTAAGSFSTVPVATPSTLGSASAPHLAAAGGWTSTIQLTNSGNTPAQAHLHFSDDNGADLPLTVTVSGVTSSTASLDANLDPYATMTVDCSGPADSPVQTGSAQLTSTGAVSAFLRFHLDPSAQEASIPFETRSASAYVVAFDNTNGLATGLAVANQAASTTDVSVIIRDSTGATLVSGTISVPSGGHSAFGLSDRFSDSANQTGTVEFITPAGGQISVLGMRLPPSGNFSAIPVLTP